MEKLYNLFASTVLDGGTVALFIGPLAFVVAVPCALALRRRRTLFWVSTSVMIAALLFAGLGLLSPMLLISGLAIPVVTLSALVALLVPPALLYWLIVSRRPQRGLEALYFACAAATVISAGSLVVIASASV